MKKSILFAAAFLSVAAFGAGTSWGVSETPQGYPSLGKFSKVSHVMLDKCMPCHTRNMDLPFYASAPGIKQSILKDYAAAPRAFDLGHELEGDAKDKPVKESTLAKMAWVASYDIMPPAKFTAVHPKAKLTPKEKDQLLQWIKDTRHKYYVNGLAAPDKQDEPIQPLPSAMHVDAKKAALGQKLFNDVRLSGDESMSCATCHDFAKAGTDGVMIAQGVYDLNSGLNTPTVFNAVFNFRQYWNGRAADVQEAAKLAPLDPTMMGSKGWDLILAKLRLDEALTNEYKEAFGTGTWTEENATAALAEFQKTLLTPDSRFDQWLKGKDDALTAEESKGYQRFKDYRCTSCHVGQSVGGQSLEYMDLKKDYFADRGHPMARDEGYKAVTGDHQDLHRFKVPNLRNVELTAPYLHDGTVQTLSKAVDVMGTYLSGISIDEEDNALIVAFLRTLTGQYQGKPLTGVVSK